MRNKLTDELAVCGINAVLAVGEYHPLTINRLFLREDRLNSFTGICKQLAERKRPYKLCEDEELERICKSVHHQGVVAMIEEPWDWTANPWWSWPVGCWGKNRRSSSLCRQRSQSWSNSESRRFFRLKLHRLKRKRYGSASYNQRFPYCRRRVWTFNGTEDFKLGCFLKRRDKKTYNNRHWCQGKTAHRRLGRHYKKPPRYCSCFGQWGDRLAQRSERSMFLLVKNPWHRKYRQPKRSASRRVVS